MHSALTLLFFGMACAPTYPVHVQRSQPHQTENGTVQFTPERDQSPIPERYRLKSHSFKYQLRKFKDYPLSGYEVYKLTFPSPVTTPDIQNNTVHAEYYRPKNKKRFPCAVVLHITGGDQKLSRMISSYLAQNGVGALFVQMAYYGPRRPPGSRKRLLSFDIGHTVKAVRQTVLDLRRAAAWMAARPEINAKEMGIMGTSLGGFMAALAAEMEPKYKRVAILLAGGGLIDAFWDDPRVLPYRTTYELLGGTKEDARRYFAPIDPLTCAANLKNRKVLMLSARKDEIVPPKMAQALWEASGKQRIVWFDTTHYGAALYFVPAMKLVLEHFQN